MRNRLDLESAQGHKYHNVVIERVTSVTDPRKPQLHSRGLSAASEVRANLLLAMIPVVNE
jgi:hypothetical protein